MAALELGGGEAAAAEESATRPPTPGEEALKRNTDCVYFLASPLTCKKGSKCEYRHSEGARVNPRDCWYWMNSNCLNPKCSFRHPPLDGLYGPPETALAQFPAAINAQLPATYAQGYNNANKQNVPCYYFQKGGCLKGDKCPFMHGTQVAANPVIQTNGNLLPVQEEKVPTSSKEEQQAPRSNTCGFKARNMQQPKVNFGKPTEARRPAAVKPAINAEVLPNNGFSNNKGLLWHPSKHELPRSQATPVPLGASYPPRAPHGCQVGPMDDHIQSCRETEEFLAESSPGFDVLADGDAEDSEYLRDEEDYGRGSMQCGRRRNLSNNFDYEHISQFEEEQFNDAIDEYDRYGGLHRRNDWEQQRSYDRIPHRPVILRREKAIHEIDRSDLRYRLKQRRLGNPRSTVSPDGRHDSYHREDCYAEKRHRGQMSSRDLRGYPAETSISSRLRGRITLPRRSPPGSADVQSERERGRGIHRGRLSPARPISNKLQARPHDRIRRSEQHENPVRECTRVRREEAELIDFAGPKSLAELKGSKTSGLIQDRKTKELGNMKLLKSVVGNQGLEGPHSFEGPQPLSVILKRKRETTPGSSALSGSEDESIKTGSDMFQHLAEADRADNYEAEEGLTHPGGEEHDYEQHLSADEDEEGMVMDTVEEYPDLENYEHRDGDYEYEIAEDGDFRADDDEEEYDDNGDDDFAKKVGMMLS